VIRRASQAFQNELSQSNVCGLLLLERERTVAVTGPYQGRRRMTFTYPALERATWIVWLVDGAEKREALTKLIARDTSIPASGVTIPDQLVVTDVDVATA